MATKCPYQVNEGLGEKSLFKQLKLSEKSHKCAQFTTDDNKFDIVLERDGDELKTLSKLERADPDGSWKDVERAVFNEMDGKKLTYQLRIREPGWYKLNIFAARKAEQADSVPGVFTYVFNVTRIRQEMHPFPRQLAAWTNGCHLYEPLSLDRSMTLEKVKFKVRIPGARKVAVKAGEAWTHLQKDEKDDDVWKGDVRLKEQFQDPDRVIISLNANCGGPSPDQYDTLLQYFTKL